MIKIFKSLLARVDLYSIDLKEIELFDEKKFVGFSFKVINGIDEIGKLDFIISERGVKYKEVVTERLSSDTFLCFGFFENLTGNAAYCRWIRTDSFYHDSYKERIRLNSHEVFTLDSYTPNLYRGLGLHKEMNRRMLNYCKENLKVKKIFMVIFSGSEFAHLHKTVKDLGYKKIHSKCYPDLGYLKAIINKLRVKFSHVKAL